jgi:hypothetical protein
MKTKISLGLNVRLMNIYENSVSVLYFFNSTMSAGEKYKSSAKMDQNDLRYFLGMNMCLFAISYPDD